MQSPVSVPGFYLLSFPKSLSFHHHSAQLKAEEEKISVAIEIEPESAILLRELGMIQKAQGRFTAAHSFWHRRDDRSRHGERNS